MIDTGEECRVELKTTMLKHYLSKEQLEVLGEELRPFMEDFTKLKLEFAIGHGIRRYLRDGFIKAHIDGEGELRDKPHNFRYKSEKVGQNLETYGGLTTE